LAFADEAGFQFSIGGRRLIGYVEAEGEEL